MTEDINNLKISMAKMETKVDNIEQGMGRLECKLDDFITTARESFAGKWVEEDLKELKDNRSWVIKLILGAIILAALGLIITTK